MKKIYKIVLILLVFYCTSIKAASYGMYLKSSNTTVFKGSTVTINVSLRNIKDIKSGLNVCQANISSSGVSILSISGSNGWNVTNGGVLILDSPNFIKSSGNIATIKVKVNNAGKVTLSNVVCSDGEKEYSAENVSISFKIKTSTNNSNKTNSKSSLLKSISVDEVKIDFDKNKFEYNLEVDNIINKINLKYEPEDSDAKVVKNGKDELTVGKNTIELVVTNGNSSSKYKININRKDIVTEVNNNETDILNALMQDINLLKVKVDINDANKFISGNILKYLKDNKKDIIYEVYDEDKIKYSFKVFGNNIADTSEIGFNIRFNSNYNNKLNDKLKDYDYNIINFDYRGKLPLDTEVVLYDINFINYIYLYYYDFMNDNLIFIKDLENQYNNSVTLKLDNTNEFVITNYKSSEFISFNTILYIVICVLILIIVLLVICFRKYKTTNKLEVIV